MAARDCYSRTRAPPQDGGARGLARPGCWFCEVAAATTMEATSREAAPAAKSSASGPSAPPALFELCGRAVSARIGFWKAGCGVSRGIGATFSNERAAQRRGARGQARRPGARPSSGHWKSGLRVGGKNSVTGRTGHSKDGDQTGR